MDLIKRKILLENYVDRTYNSPNWGTITADTFYIKINLTQNIDDIGLFSDMDFIEKNGTTPIYTLLINKLNNSGFTTTFMSGASITNITGLTYNDNINLRNPNRTINQYYNSQNLKITGSTDSKIESLKSYDLNEEYKINLNIEKDTYINYLGQTIDGVSRVKSLSDPKIYVFETNDDQNLGTINQVSGIQYQDYSGLTRSFKIDGVNTTIPLTNFTFIGEGSNETNTNLKAISKEEYLFGVTIDPEIQNDIFITRGQTNVIDMHQRLSEINNLGELNKYGNGFYRLNKEL